MRRFLRVAILLLVICVAGVFGVGEVLTRPVLHPVGAAPSELGAETVSLKTASGSVIVGWFSEGKQGAGAVLLLHGVRADRRDMLGRALALKTDGYSVLLIDLPSHGESPGDRITFGLQESAGVTAALRFLRERLPEERIGVIGVSLGAASLVFARPSPAPAAVVLESMYPTIREAVENRLTMRLGPVGKVLAPVLLWQLPVRMDITEQDVRPIALLPALKSPVMIVAGDMDKHTTLAETQRLFAAAGEPKQLWIVPGAAHVNLFNYGPEAYREHVFGFLEQHLRDQDGTVSRIPVAASVARPGVAPVTVFLRSPQRHE